MDMYGHITEWGRLGFFACAVYALAAGHRTAHVTREVRWRPPSNSDLAPEMKVGLKKNKVWG